MSTKTFDWADQQEEDEKALKLKEEEGPVETIDENGIKTIVEIKKNASGQRVRVFVHLMHCDMKIILLL